MKIRLYTPFFFQGNLNNQRYFEGWYFKHISADQQSAWSFIPGISLNSNDSHAFIQAIDGINGVAEYIKYPISEFKFDYKKSHLTIGTSTFSEEYIKLNIENNRTEIKGEIEYHNQIKFPQSLLSPGIMGWYSFVPFMECRHGIISVNHRLSGSIFFNGTPFCFDAGNGYIEKDWGTSFPEAWFWIQSNNFKSVNASLFFSIAKIPWIGRYFLGFISYLYFENRFYNFSTHNGSIVTDFRRKNEKTEIKVENKKYKLHMSTIMSGSGELRAPVQGRMSRKIKESINSEVSVRMTDSGNNVVFDDTGFSAGLEISDKIFDY
jgi:tocopherol cyclase